MLIATALNATTGSFTVWTRSGQTQDIPLPASIKTSGKPDFISWTRGAFRRTYILGGHTENMVFTEHKRLLRMGIYPLSNPIVNAVPVLNQIGVVAAGGGGLTGSCRFALRWLDSLHFRRSPLSAASPAIALTNQGATFSGVPVSPDIPDASVDSLEVWVSVDGGLFRHWSTIDVGTTSFTINTTATGEAYDSAMMYPKVAFGCIATDRLVAAGDKLHPERVYFSNLGSPEEYGGIYIPTRNGEPVIGLKNIGGTIYVQCPNSCYYIQGFGPADYAMRPLKANLGGFGQDTIVLVDDIALIPTQRALMKCDGTSMVPVGIGDWDDTWRKTVSNPTRRSCYEDGFSVVDLVSGVMKFLPRAPDVGEDDDPDIIGFPNAGVAVNNYWIVNLAGLIPELGGAGQADLSFDQVNGAVHTCAAMLFEPGAYSGELFSGTIDGDILVENQIGNVDRITSGGVETEVPITFIQHTNHGKIGPVMDDEDAFQVTDAMVNFQADNLQGTLGVYAGNEFAWQAGAPATIAVPTSAFAAPEEFTIPYGYLNVADTDIQNACVPRDRWVQPSLAQSPGSCVSLRLTVTQSSDRAAESVRLTIHQRAEVVFYGYGYLASPGPERRPLSKYMG